MKKIGFRNRIGGFTKRRVVSAIILLALIAGGFWAGPRLLGGSDEVGYKVLSEMEIPRQISAQVIPEYRQLERALASIIDGKVYVVATRGEKPTTGYELEIAKMTLEEEEGQNTLVVFVKFRDPQPGMSLTQALTYPLLVAETELTKLPDQIRLKVQYVE